MKNFIRLFISLIFIIISAVVNSQSSKEIREIFAQAESHYLYEEYELANPLYLSLLSFMPDNCNIMYKIGNCYLNIPDEKEKAIEYLEKAVKNTAHNAKTELLKEKRAPLDAYFSLGKAYMVNNKIEEAINTFKIFQKLVKESP
ncbi:MAG TPA: tetratricopeptide repeat protein, partial [Bacteroidales bacterium]|nr:tetratricopeptide repeat protein [Bacteroidales bacterium]